jgi:N-acetylmuramoyl-L-alanine amidase
MRKFFQLSLACMSGLALSATVPAWASTTSSVVVQQGQSMWSIAHAHQISVLSLESANPSVDPTNLQVGTTLTLPTAQVNTYLVQNGDTLWLIAHRLNVSIAALQQANPTINPNNLLVGTALTLPQTVQPASSAQASASTANQSTSATQSDLYWMSHIISAEAQGEPYDAQVAVGDVVWHREQAKYYPNTVKGVAFQKINGYYQFTCVANGFIYNSPTASAVKAAKAVLVNHVDVVPGAYVFYNPAKTAQTSWVWSQPTIGHIGAFIFAQ